MITRTLAPKLRRLAGQFPVVTLTGPRQSGKTTLCRREFAHHRQVSLEGPDVRRLAAEDPRGFLGAHPASVIIDEVRRVTELLSYIQVAVDEAPQPGGFVLTGSANFALLSSVMDRSFLSRTSKVPPSSSPEPPPHARRVCSIGVFRELIAPNTGTSTPELRATKPLGC